MSRFFVGQRVRVVDTLPHCREIVGIVTTIIGQCTDSWCAGEWMLDPNDFRSFLRKVNGKSISAASWALEPIDDRHTPADQEFCEWLNRVVGMVKA